MGELPRRLYAAYNDHDPSAVAHLYAPHATHEDVAHGRPRSGPEAIAAGLRLFFGWFPDAHWQPAFQIGDGPDRVAIPYRLTASLQAQMGPIAPRGQAISLRGVQVLEIEDGRIGRSVDYWDAATFQRQLNDITAEESK
jgi:steroid delta-isomerase-like uncharacterized protein